jgi:hypothetical protein
VVGGPSALSFPECKGSNPMLNAKSIKQGGAGAGRSCWPSRSEVNPPRNLIRSLPRSDRDVSVSSKFLHLSQTVVRLQGCRVAAPAGRSCLQRRHNHAFPFVCVHVFSTEVRTLVFKKLLRDMIDNMPVACFSVRIPGRITSRT